MKFNVTIKMPTKYQSATHSLTYSQPMTLIHKQFCRRSTRWSKCL